MVEQWDDLDTTEENDIEAKALVQNEDLDKKIAYDKIFLNCVATPEGELMVKTLRERLVDRVIYQRGSTLEETAYRQGQADVLAMIDSCVNSALSTK